MSSKAVEEFLEIQENGLFHAEKQNEPKNYFFKHDAKNAFVGKREGRESLLYRDSERL